MKEVWKPVWGFTGCYEVSNLGRVRSLGHRCRNHLTGGWSWIPGKILKPTRDKWAKVPYLYVSLCRNSKVTRRRVHNLVARAFLGSCPSGEETRHGLNGLDDNSVANLCYGTHSENMLDRRRDGTANVRAVRCNETGVVYPRLTAASLSIFGNKSSSGNIGAVCRGEKPRAGGFTWSWVTKGGRKSRKPRK